MKHKKLLICLLATIFFPAAAFAHLPRLVGSGDLTEVSRPEISQAFYGELSNAPHFFEIKIDRPQDLYLNILVPDIKDIKKDISAELYRQAGADKQSLKILDGSDFSWQKFHEEFANDDYFKGPEFKTEVPAGTYVVKVFSPRNTGKYVFVVGETESFPLNESIKLVWILPLLKINFFNTSPLTLAGSVLGKFFLGGLAGLVILMAIIALIVKKLRKPKKTKNRK